MYEAWSRHLIAFNPQDEERETQAALSDGLRRGPSSSLSAVLPPALGGGGPRPEVAAAAPASLRSWRPHGCTVSGLGGSSALREREPSPCFWDPGSLDRQSEVFAATSQPFGHRSGELLPCSFVDSLETGAEDAGSSACPSSVRGSWSPGERVAILPGPQPPEALGCRPSWPLKLSEPR